MYNPYFMRVMRAFNVEFGRVTRLRAFGMAAGYEAEEKSDGLFWLVDREANWRKMVICRPAVKWFQVGLEKEEFAQFPLRIADRWKGVLVSNGEGVTIGDVYDALEIKAAEECRRFFEGSVGEVAVARCGGWLGELDDRE